MPEKFTATGSNSVKVEVTLEATADIDQAGSYFCLELPGSEFVDGTFGVFSDRTTNNLVTLRATIPDGRAEYSHEFVVGQP